jgi:hypothetical protein
MKALLTGAPPISSGFFGFFVSLTPPVPTTSCGGRGGLASAKLKASNMCTCPDKAVIAPKLNAHGVFKGWCTIDGRVFGFAAQHCGMSFRDDLVRSRKIEVARG